MPVLSSTFTLQNVSKCYQNISWFLYFTILLRLGDKWIQKYQLYFYCWILINCSAKSLQHQQSGAILTMLISSLSQAATSRRSWCPYQRLIHKFRNLKRDQFYFRQFSKKYEAFCFNPHRNRRRWLLRWCQRRMLPLLRLGRLLVSWLLDLRNG